MSPPSLEPNRSQANSKPTIVHTHLLGPDDPRYQNHNGQRTRNGSSGSIHNHNVGHSPRALRRNQASPTYNQQLLREQQRQNMTKSDIHRHKLLGKTERLVSRSRLVQDNRWSSRWRRFSRKLRCFLLSFVLPLALVLLTIFVWPHAGPPIQTQVGILRPRLKFAGPLAVNEHLDKFGEVLFKDEFHGPESQAWTSDRHAFYTGVEGGFILRVEPELERWFVVARLNARRAVIDDTPRLHFLRAKSASSSSSGPDERELSDFKPAGSPDVISSEFAESDWDGLLNSKNESLSDKQAGLVPYCPTDVKLYGPRAEFQPSLVTVSRCSKPLGLRLSPDNTYLYAVDPLSGLYKIELELEPKPGKSIRSKQVSKLLDFSQDQLDSAYNYSLAANQQPFDKVRFADDIAVEWANPATADDDKIYLSDCSRKNTLRYLVKLLIENDDSGRLLSFDMSTRQLKEVQVLPVRHQDNDVAQPQQLAKDYHVQFPDYSGLSFPNGLELSASGEALLISDLANRRILVHQLRGARRGQTRHLMWTPCYADNIKRGLDKEDGEPTYWTGCACAVSDSSTFELREFFNDYTNLKTLVLKIMQTLGKGLEWLGRQLEWTSLSNAGFCIKTMWLARDPYCSHGMIFQFDERGQILRSLHAPHSGSNFRLVSEVQQVPIGGNSADASPAANLHAFTSQSSLYLGSCFYSYVGRVNLEALGRESSPTY